MAKLADALDMSAEDRADLYLLTGRLPPAPAMGGLRHTPEMACTRS